MKIAFLAIAVLSLVGLSSCVSPGRNHYAETYHLVKWKAPVGGDIRLARYDLLAEGLDVSLPYDPTNMGEVYWTIVRYKDCPNWLDREFCPDKTRSMCPPLAVIVESDQYGTIRRIRR